MPTPRRPGIKQRHRRPAAALDFEVPVSICFSAEPGEAINQADDLPCSMWERSGGPAMPANNEANALNVASWYRELVECAGESGEALRLSRREPNELVTLQTAVPIAGPSAMGTFLVAGDDLISR